MEEELKLKYIIPYMIYKLNVLVDGIICEVEGVDIYNSNTIIAERVNYKLLDIKPILYPLSDYTKFEEILDEMTEYEISMINDNPDLVKRLPYDVIEKMLKNHIDIFGLIYSDLAINANTLK